MTNPRAPSANEASEFEATIARIERVDPGSPAALSVKLDYADFLLSEARGPCATRLLQAQEQLGSVAANPETSVAFPGGWARIADLEYRVHLARAACGSEADRRVELLAAAAAAQRAVELYRNVFDYRSMVTLKFNASVTLHRLGENAAAIASLRSALDMDREYGFRDDAAENAQLLLTWRGEPAGAAQVARLLQDFPMRRVSLEFAWRPGNAYVTVESRRQCLAEGRITRSRAAATFERRIDVDPGGGIGVSYAHRLAGYEPGVWPLIEQAPPAQFVFPPAPLPSADFKVSAKGEFAGVTGSEAFAARLIAKTDGLIRARAPTGQRAGDLTNDALAMTATDLSPGMLEAATAENYALETSMWIGATLEQGVWYEISAPLSLPGIPSVVVRQRIAFTFTRTVPCTAGAAGQACVEIVIRARPDEEALEDVTPEISPSMHYSASLEARIVTDPATLTPYAREEWSSWYVSLGKNSGLLESEHLVSTTSYGSQGEAHPRSSP